MSASQRKAQQKAKDQGEGHKAQTSRRPAGVKVETPAAVEETPVAVPSKTRPGSIRQTILSGLDAGQTNEQIAETLKAQFPTSKAAEKSAKHIAFYKASRKRDAKKAAEAPAKA